MEVEVAGPLLPNAGFGMVESGRNPDEPIGM
jgi:hypothetical protein